MKDWITIFPDYPRAFAWHRKAVDEKSLDSSVGGLCGEISVDGTVLFNGEVIEGNLAERIKGWMERWLAIEDRLIASTDEKSYEDAIKDGGTVDDDGIEIAKEMKSRYGDRFRFRYSRAWEHGDIDWTVV